MFEELPERAGRDPFARSRPHSHAEGVSPRKRRGLRAQRHADQTVPSGREGLESGAGFRLEVNADQTFPSGGGQLFDDGTTTAGVSSQDVMGTNTQVSYRYLTCRAVIISLYDGHGLNASQGGFSQWAIRATLRTCR